ncbi:hypothetical protein N7481_001565 [Penicillium waksmanii]|uniref:uncharacterized protein n=1 Tax=Penicillium waksmanii TaxID=69791 RepID=UPI0025475F17|nr:uncharacterized protein N7481_001565 [Penicillium waksmanii]KAJ6001156.1 hypothetical protein N7481_001565 [Penicillium waksmanii]
MTSQYNAIKMRIQTACSAARVAKNPNIAALARKYDVPMQRLRARYLGRASRSTRHMAYKRLNDEQEASLVGWIRRLDNLHIPPTAGMVVVSANALLRRDNPAVRPLGKDWVYDFVNVRLPNDLNWVHQKPADQNRITGEDIGVLTAWYERLEPFIKRIPAKHVYNFDETGFTLSQGRPQNVISANPKRTRTHSFERGQLLTGIECIAADGWKMEPYFVAPGSVHLMRWYEGGKLSEATRIVVSGTGYSNDLLALDWLDFFHLNTKDRLPKKRIQPRLLIMDGHRSHLTYEFLDRCDFYNIIPYCCPAHTTHIIQPLDRSPFRALKQAYRTKNNQITQWGGDARDIGVFFEEITQIRKDALQPRTIRNAFATRGILPYNLDLIIKPLVEAQTPKPELQIFDSNKTPQLQVASSIPSSPPKSSADARRTCDKVKSLLNRDDVPADIRRQIQRVAKSQVQLTEDIGLLYNTLENRLPKKPTIARKSQKQLGKFGALTTKDAIRFANDRKTKDERKEYNAAVRNQVPLGTPATPTPITFGQKYPDYTPINVIDDPFPC